MNTPYVRAPHQEGSGAAGTHTAPNAALLIDFDNVTMGMRSDLSKELKSLLNSDIIKGKVAVQRAYADWRRYPQYIVPLSEASIDLIFAPAYGSSKKNATDIRMAIDGMELVFTRPEIGTFILLTGDSDFSSLVLKLKEYGKYVIGVGIQESSSDILVQNCDEYYSYTSLAGLRKTTDADTEAVDPWLLVEKALERMQNRNDVMRSDRLKQVMLEIDTGFDESEYGFSKFSRFLTEASSKGLIELKRMDNGQYEVRPSTKAGRGGGRDSGAAREARGGREAKGGREKAPRETRSGGDGGGSRETPTPPPSTRGSRTRGRATRSRGRESKPAAAPQPEQKTATAPSGRGDGVADGQQAGRPEKAGDSLQEAYGLLTDTLEQLLRERNASAIRDSDVKRKMLDRDRSFDEAELGFSKFSLFLRQADESGVIRLRQRDTGNYEVSLSDAESGSREAEPVARKEEPVVRKEEPVVRKEEPVVRKEEPVVRKEEPVVGKEEPVAREAESGLGKEQSVARKEEAPAETDTDTPFGEVQPPPGDGKPRPGQESGHRGREREAVKEKEDAAAAESADRPPATESAPAEEPASSSSASKSSRPGRGLGPRRGERPGRTRKSKDAAPPILEGQIVGSASRGSTGTSSGSASDRGGAATSSGSGQGAGAVVAPEALGLPTDGDAVVRYLTNSYKGVGEKTAEALVDQLGPELFTVLQRQPERVRDVLPANRADQLLEAWEDDLSRRKDGVRSGPGGDSSAGTSSALGSGSGRRTRS